MSDTSTEAPAVPVTPEMVRAAQAWDYEHRPKYQPWTRVPNGQVKRLLAGALGPEGVAVDAGELAAFGTAMDRAQRLIGELQGGIDAVVSRAVEAERDRIRTAVEDLKFALLRPGNGPAQGQLLEVVPVEALLGLLAPAEAAP